MRTFLALASLMAVAGAMNTDAQAARVPVAGPKTVLRPGDEDQREKDERGHRRQQPAGLVDGNLRTGAGPLSDEKTKEIVQNFAELKAAHDKYAEHANGLVEIAKRIKWLMDDVKDIAELEKDTAEYEKEIAELEKLTAESAKKIAKLDSEMAERAEYSLGPGGGTQDGPPAGRSGPA